MIGGSCRSLSSHCLAMDSQTDEVGHIALSWYEVTSARHRMKKAPVFTIWDTEKQWAPNISEEDIPTTQVQRDNLSSMSKEFLNRMEEEFEIYMKEPDTDQLMAMYLHPVTCAMAFT